MDFKAELRGMASAGLLAFAAALFLVSVPRGLPGVELLQSLRFHLAALGLPLAVLLVMTGARWRSLLVLVLLVTSVGQGMLPLLDGYDRRAEIGGETLGTIKVLSFNVLSGRDGRAAADFIIETAPDIAVIMETPAIEPYLDDVAAVLPYRLGCERAVQCDIAVLSRTPLVYAKMYRLPPFNHERLAVVSTMIDGETVTVAGIHLSKPYFDENAWFELAYGRRVLDSIEGRLIVAGDFNAAAWSDQVAAFSKAADLVPPPFYPATWPVRAGDLGVPIDNMFTRGDMLIDTIEAVANSYGSNHRALLAQVSVRSRSGTLQ